MMNRQIRRAQAKQDRKADRDKEERRAARKRKLEQLRALEHGFAIHVVETEGDTREVDSPEDARQLEEFLRGRSTA